ncbi:trypsin-like peptidase domain-containing protein [Paraglaciecola aquimarina]|uniref:Trypsin-like peptidase domain-containing protein n=1 Tax=Paraglaciecola algarum TaxID=3050085 RepID=A0ABS9D4B6_9ALTE|nr:trypsin-like peptidase domain-containing protein [Paraglaciecola sp. G1-23]
MPRLLTSILKSILIGIIISSIILILVPDLRQGSGLPLTFFQSQDKTGKKLTYSQAVNLAGPAIVNVYSQSLDSANSYRRQPLTRSNLGSGVIMSAEGYVLTCLHVIENAVTTKNNIIVVGLQDGRLAEAQIVGFDPVTDLAVLSISQDNLHVVPQKEQASNLVGDVVLAIGNPYNLGQTVTQGIVSRINNNGLNYYFDYIQTDAELYEGNSGGAIVDSEGYLIGIASANFKTRIGNRIENVEGLSFAIPYSLAKKVMDEIIASGKVTRGALGFNGEQIAGGQVGSGILVTGVVRGKPAELGGLQVNDIILSVDGLATTSIRDTLNYITNTAPGTSVKLEVTRNSQNIELTMEVAELN